MNKRMLITVSVILLLFIGGISYLLATSDQNKPDKGAKPNSQTAQKDSESETQPDTKVPGAYVDYKDDVIASTEGTKLLFFHAPWCPQCRALEADIKEQGVPTGVTIIKVDYDSNQKLRQTYGVTLQTTIVKVDDNGKLVEKFVAYDDPTLAAITKELL